MDNKTPNWDWANSILYNMCLDKPNHDDINITVGKLNIIGRTYSASIERGAGDNFNIINAAKKINNSKIDELLKQIRLIDFPTQKNIEDILEVHKKFTDILHRTTGLKKRSLASKYLHFHAPKAFFIYDSIANKKIREELKHEKLKFKISNDFDKEYADFAYRCLFFRDNFHKGKSPREIDKELLGY